MSFIFHARCKLGRSRLWFGTSYRGWNAVAFGLHVGFRNGKP